MSSVGLSEKTELEPISASKTNLITTIVSFTQGIQQDQNWPRGICSDALSHILVCDCKTQTVQMMDKVGQFLSHLLIRPSGIFYPYSLSYDVSTHRLLVGSLDHNKMCIYRYLTRQDSLTGNTQYYFWQRLQSMLCSY